MPHSEALTTKIVAEKDKQKIEEYLTEILIPDPNTDKAPTLDEEILSPRDYSVTTLLHEAVIGNNTLLVEALMARNVNIHILAGAEYKEPFAYINENTAIEIKAIYERRLQEEKRLEEKQKEIEALKRAIELINMNPDPEARQIQLNQKTNGKTFVQRVIELNQAELLKKLLALGASIYVKKELKGSKTAAEQFERLQVEKDQGEMLAIIVEHTKYFLELQQGNLPVFIKELESRLNPVVKMKQEIDELNRKINSLMDNAGSVNAIDSQEKLLTTKLVELNNYRNNVIFPFLMAHPWIKIFLQQIINKKQFQLLGELIHLGLPLNFPDANGDTVWDVALALKDEALIKFLLEKTKPLVTVRPETELSNYPPLKKYFQNDENDKFSLLLANGLSPNYNPDDSRELLVNLTAKNGLWDAYQNTKAKDMLQTIGFDPNFVAKQDIVRKVGHKMGLKSAITVPIQKGKEETELLSIDPQGSDYTVAQPWVRESIDFYLEHLKKTNADKTQESHFQVIKRAFADASPTEKLRRFQAGEMVSAVAGFQGHYINTFFYEDIFGVTNRGNGRDLQYGSLLYHNQNQNYSTTTNPFEQIKTSFLDWMGNQKKEDFDNFIRETICAGSKTCKPFAGTIQGSQKYGTCGYINSNSSIQPMLRVLIALQFIKEGKFEDKINKSKSKITLKEAILDKEVIKLANKQYKDYKRFSRDRELLWLATQVQQNLATNETTRMADFYYNCLAAVVAKHQDPAKDNGAEIKRSKEAYELLPAPYQKQLLNDNPLLAARFEALNIKTNAVSVKPKANDPATTKENADNKLNTATKQNTAIPGSDSNPRRLG